MREKILTSVAVVILALALMLSSGLASQGQVPSTGGEIHTAIAATTNEIALNNYSKTFKTVSTPSMMCTADFNHDELTDIAIVSSTTNKLEIYCQLTDGSFPSTPNYTTTVPSTPTSIACGDLSGIGTCDLAIGCGASKKVALIHESGGFQYAGGVDELSTYYAVSGVGIADFDTDGRNDIVTLVTNGFASRVEFHFFSKSYSYGTGHTITGSPNADGFCITDFDGDSRPDLVVTDSGAGRLTAVWNNLTAGGVVLDMENVTILTSITGLATPVKPIAKSMAPGEPDYLIVTMRSGAQIAIFKYSGSKNRVWI
jgi:hypothetical protein